MSALAGHTATWREMPARIATGAFILNSGVDKAGADDQTAQGLHGMASGAYPFLGGRDPKGFVGTLSKGEIALGALLLTPLVPTVVAGAALTGFSAALLGMYLRTPGLTREDGVRPTPDGIGIAKDVFMLGIGVSMLVDGLGRLRSRRG
jgi:hypothetical protein